VDNYRPVSLLSVISKIFERAAYNQLYNYFKIKKIIPQKSIWLQR